MPRRLSRKEIIEMTKEDFDRLREIASKESMESSWQTTVWSGEGAAAFADMWSNFAKINELQDKSDPDPTGESPVSQQQRMADRIRIANEQHLDDCQCLACIKPWESDP